MIKKENVLLVLGLMALAGLGYWFLTQYKVYTVYSIRSHYERPNNNSETALVVYEKGTSGNVKDLLCLFPPDFHLDNNAKNELTNDKSEPNLKGIKKVRVLKKAKEYYFGEIGYHCEKVE